MASVQEHPSVQLQVASANDCASDMEEATAGESLLSSHAVATVAATAAMVPARTPPTPLQAVITGGDALMLDERLSESSSSQSATTDRAWPRRIPPVLYIGLVVALFHGSVFLIGRSGVRPELDTVAGLPGIEEKFPIGLSSEHLLDGWTPTTIAWATQPNKCWKVSAKPDEYQNGMKLMLWDCNSADEFILPNNGEEGPIRPAANSEFCLDAPSGKNELQFWLCSSAPAKNTRFSLPRRGKMGFIQAVSDPTHCIDVPEGVNDNGRELIRWKCGDHQMNMIFLLRRPYDCSWAPWSEWSSCSTHCRTWRSRGEHNVEQGSTSSGNSCAGTEEEVKGCTWGYCDADGAELVT